VDIKRERPPRTKKLIAYGGSLAAVLAVSIGVSQLEPAAPPVERGTLWIDTVKQGAMTRDVNAPGTLVPDNPRNITALTSGRIEALPVKPGINVTTSTVLAVMSNPDEDIKQLQNEQLLNAAVAQLQQLKTSLYQQILQQQGAVAAARTQYNSAVRMAAVQDGLATKQLASTNDIAAARDAVVETKQRLEIEQRRLDDVQGSQAMQIQLQEQQITSLRRILDEQKRRVGSMTVRSPEAGQLQSLGNPPLELGQYVNAGTLVARVVQPGRLKAVLRVAENQARDVVPGLPAQIDLHNQTTVKGHVTRTDPSSVAGTVTVEVAIDDPLPAGTRSDLAVDGTVQLERIANTRYVGRPGFGQAQSAVGMFRIVPNKGEAVRVSVLVGRASVNSIEIRSGLAVGDSVIISDMSQFDNTNRVRIK
jgi:multidrug resistance efflux pump